MLSTEFNNIPANNRGKRIKALYQEILRQADALTIPTVEATAESQAVEAWYERNTAKLIYNAVKANKLESLATAAPESFKTLMEQEKKSNYVERVRTSIAYFMSDGPENSVGEWLSGKQHEIQDAFLNKLKEKGEKIIAEANDQLISQTTRLEIARKSGQENLIVGAKSYADLVNALTGRDAEGVLEILQSEQMQRIPEYLRYELLSMPVADEKSAILALTACAHSKDEEEKLIARFIAATGSGEGVTLLAQACAQVTEAQQDDFRKYLKSHAGLAVQINSDWTMNANAYVNASYGKGLFTITNHDGSRTEFDMSREKAHALLEILSAGPGYMAIAGNYAININAYASASYEDNKLELHEQDGSYIRFTMDEQEASQVLKQLAKMPPYSAFNERNVINTNAYQYVAYAEGTLRMKKQNGKYTHYNIGEEKAADLLAALEARPNYIRIENELLNMNAVSNISYDETNQRLDFEDAGGSGIAWFTMEREAASALFDKVAQRPGFIRLNDDIIVNMNLIADVDYNYTSKDRLVFGNTGGHAILRVEMTEAQAKPIIDALAERPNFMRIADNIVVNTNAVADVDYDRSSKGRLALGNAGGRMIANYEMTHEKAQPIIYALAERANFIRTDKDAVINFFSIGDVRYIGDMQPKISYRGPGRDQITSVEMDSSKARACFNSLHKVGLTMAQAQSEYLTMQQELGLEAAESSSYQSSYSSSYTDTSGTDMLMAAATISLMSSVMDTFSASSGMDMFNGGGGSFGGGGSSGSWNISCDIANDPMMNPDLRRKNFDFN